MEPTTPSPGPTAPVRQPAAAASEPVCVVLTGNPNSGKTTVFNALTGLRARVGNYAGVTVERKEGRLQNAPPNRPVTILDLPGTYSLSPQSLDEQIARDVLFQRLPEVPAPSLVVVVVDASNLERNLYFATQVIELGRPTAIALNMTDVAERNGHIIDTKKLSALLGAPVLPLVASDGKGVAELRETILDRARPAADLAPPRLFCDLPPAFAPELERLGKLLPGSPPIELLLILTDDKFLNVAGRQYPKQVHDEAAAGRQRLEAAGIEWRSAAIEARYGAIGAICRTAITDTGVAVESFSDKVDRIVTHKVWGLAIFVGIMTLMFLSIFTFAQWPMDGLTALFEWVGKGVAHVIPPGDLQSLLQIGVVKGVGAVVNFLPQICLLFLFIGILEDSGYMARAAFLMDRIMGKVGLHGKSFIPMLSSFACAIPGIMATRTIESPKDRLVTILVAPLMSCSARLPVYTLLIGACIAGGVVMKSVVMLAMYLLGIVGALVMAWLFKKTLLKGETPMMVMELPPYRKPVFKVVLRHMWDRAKLFLQRAGTVILGINILLWFLTEYPRQADGRRAEIQHSYAGAAGRLIEPVVKPLGFDWKMGVGIISSFAAREVFVSTMSTVYSQEEDPKMDEDARNLKLQAVLREQKFPGGEAAYTSLRAVTLMVFYVFAMQCASTVAVVRRETNSWRWPLFQWIYMGVLAWGLAFLTYQGGRWLGFR